MRAMETYWHQATVRLSDTRETAGLGIVCLWSLTGLMLSIVAAAAYDSDIGILLAAAL